MLAANIKKITAFILTALFIMAEPYVNPAKVYAMPENASIGREYIKATENEDYELYLYEPAMSVILKDKATGALIRSTVSDADDDGKNNSTWNAYMKSGIVLTAIKGTTDTYQVDLIKSPNTINYTYFKNGFSAEIYFIEYNFGLTVNVTLEGKDLIAEVLDESITEKGEGMYIGTVSLFPFMGYTYLDSQRGYMLIPDGNGALIYLDDKNKKFTTGFSQMIYGSDIGFAESSTDTLLWGFYKTVRDPKKVTAPVFGMVHSDDRLGYLAIVEKGDERASIEAHPNGVMVDYNRCFAKFLVRRIYIQPLNNSNSGTVTTVEADRNHSGMRVRYRILSQDMADYSGMAVSYRDYLLNNDLLTVKNTDYKTRVDFLGTDREKFLFFTKAVPMTTASQIREIYNELQEAGVKSLLTVYKGWQNGGLYNVPITKYKADSAVGGTSALSALIKDSAKRDYQIYLYNNALRANPQVSNTTFNSVKRVNKRRLEINTWGQVYQYFNYLLPVRTRSILDKFIASYAKEGINNLALAGITDNIFSYSQSGSFYSRFSCMDSYSSTVSELANSSSLALENPFSYLWDDACAMLDMPVVSSSYMYVDEEIPFFSIVLKGIVPMYSEYVNFEANKKEFLLKMIEAGVYPSFYLTYKDSSDLVYTNSSHLYSTLYETYRGTVIEYDALFRQIAKEVEGALIIRHERFDKVSVVTYNNGAAIYINYSKSPAAVNGYTIEGMSYLIAKDR